MFWIPINKFKNVFFVVILFSCSGVILGDTLQTKDTRYSGYLISADKDNMYFSVGCDRKENIKTFPKRKIRRYEQNDKCNKEEKPNIPGGLDLDTCIDETDQNQIVYVVNFGNKQKVYASEVELKEDGTLTIQISNSDKKLVGPINKVQIISHLCVEKKDIPSDYKFPTEFSQN